MLWRILSHGGTPVTIGFNTKSLSLMTWIMTGGTPMTKRTPPCYRGFPIQFEKVESSLQLLLAFIFWDSSLARYPCKNMVYHVRCRVPFSRYLQMLCQFRYRTLCKPFSTIMFCPISISFQIVLTNILNLSGMYNSYTMQPSM